MDGYNVAKSGFSSFCEGTYKLMSPLCFSIAFASGGFLSDFCGLYQNAVCVRGYTASKDGIKDLLQLWGFRRTWTWPIHLLGGLKSA